VVRPFAQVMTDVLLGGTRRFLTRRFGIAALGRSLDRAVRSLHARAPAAPHVMMLMRRSLPLLSERIGDHPTLGEPAATAAMSRSHFSRVFHGAVGMSLRDYVARLRLNRATELMLGSTLSLTAVAVEAGFYDLPHFDKRPWPARTEALMMELQRLLDGLEVSVEPFVGCTDGAVLELADGVTVRLADDSVIVLPPARRAVNGGIRITFEGSISLFHHLREPLVERVAASDPLRACFEELLHELNGHRPGSRGMAEALLRRCLILLLRRCCERGFRPEWVAALEDPRLGRVIAAMHDRPEQTFTLLDLADLAGMSRSVFAPGSWGPWAGRRSSSSPSCAWRARRRSSPAPTCR